MSHSSLTVYCVGGAVRDKLLGLPVQDHDWVVVGSTPEEMVARGFKPVGDDFPVFLHPDTHEEYALARTERKVSQGYKGFTVYTSPDVTLEQDLLRRDFTINAIAQDADGNLIDPYGGQADLKAGILRHVSDAFVRRPGAHPARRALRGALRFCLRTGNHGTDAHHRGQRRSGCAGRRTCVAGTGARPDGKTSLANSSPRCANAAR